MLAQEVANYGTHGKMTHIFKLANKRRKSKVFFKDTQEISARVSGDY